MFARIKEYFFSSNQDQAVETVEPEFPLDWVKSNSDLTDWQRFYDPSLVQQWSEELKRAIATGSDVDWTLLGPNVLIVGDEVETLKQMAHQAASSAGYQFVEVPASACEDFTECPRSRFEKLGPVVVLLNEGPWCGLDEDKSIIHNKPPAWRRQWQTIDPSHPVVFVMCIKDIDELHEDWKKFGAFDRCISIQAADALFLGQTFLQLLNDVQLDKSLTSNVQKVGLILQNEFSTHDAQSLAALQLRRLAAREKRTLGFNDLANLAIRGSEEISLAALKPPTEQSRRKTAYHEAGHACIAVIESRGQNIPDYCSIVPAKDFAGIMMHSLSYLDSLDEFTFENLLLRTRIALAGRAAEEIYYGPEGISSGASSDLSGATRLCYRMFARAGFHPLMEQGEGTAQNLAVVVFGEIDELQNDRIHKDVRQFLAKQYEYVLARLKDHHEFVEAVVSRLMWDPIIDQDEMLELARPFNVLKEVA